MIVVPAMHARVACPIVHDISCINLVGFSQVWHCKPKRLILVKLLLSLGQFIISHESVRAENISASLQWSVTSWILETKTPNLSKTEENGHYSVQNTFSNAFYKYLWILIEISLMLVVIDDHSALFPLKASYQTGDEPLSEPMMIPFSDVNMCHNT